MKEEDLFENEEVEIVGYCLYCKDEIVNGEEFVVKNRDMYHLVCYTKMTHFCEDYADLESDTE